ncbi:MAG: hypothetical protein WBG92_13785 [Thiohalocapsa sp.]
MSDEEFIHPLDTLWVKYPPKDLSIDDKLIVEAREAFSDFQLESRDDNEADNHGAVLYISIMANGACEKFKNTGDPVHAIGAIELCHLAGVYPPVEVLEWLSRAFIEYYASGGTEDLVKLLGLRNQAGKNMIGDFKRYNASYSQGSIVGTLVDIFGVSIDDAALMVWAREGEQGKDPPKAAWIAEQYRKVWRSKFSSDEIRGLFYPEDDHQSALEFLSSFPDWSLPPALKDRIKELNASQG